MTSHAPHLKLIHGGGDGYAHAAVSANEILVGIPVLNEADHIEACLQSLLIGDDRLSGVKFIIADGGSTDGTREILDRLSEAYENVEWIDNPGRLQAVALNLIARRAVRQSILVRCDAHSIYPPGYVTAVADALRQRNVASLVVPMDACGDKCFQKANAWVVDTPLGSGGSAHRGGTESKYVEHGHHAGFDLELFTLIGGYDETFSHNEDAEYDARVAHAGGRIFLDADIRLSYKPRDTVRGLWRQYYGYGKGRARNMRKHGTPAKPRQMFPLLSLFALVASAVIAPWTILGWVYPAFYFGILGAASLWLAVRHKALCGLLGGLAALTMHLSWAVGFSKQWLSGRA